MGSLVSFHVVLNAQGKPQAQDLDIGTSDFGGGKGAPRGYAQPEIGKLPESYHEGGLGRYVGTIKRFDPEKHFGFIDCPEVMAEYGKDAYLSDKQIGSFGNGSRVSFEVSLNNL